MPSEPPTHPRRSRTPIAAAAALLLLFGALSWFAVTRKSPTMDEPLHSVGAYLHVFARDFRINPEDPPLWNYWTMLPHRRGQLLFDPRDDVFIKSLQDTNHQAFYTMRALFLTPGIDGEAFVRSSRFMMLLIGVALGGLIAWWGWRLGGATTMLVATALYALDPNFLGHAPLVKNDVAITLCFVAIAMTCWSVGRRMRWWNLALLALLCGVAMSVKFSGVLAPVMILLILLARAILPQPWTAFGHEARSSGLKLAAAGAALFVCGVMSVAIVWLSYGFRYEPTPEPGVRLNMPSQADATKRNLFFLEHNQRYPTDEELSEMPSPVVVQVIEFANRHRLLPHAYLYGFLFTYQSSLVRLTYLLGEHSVVGWWYYFPLAMLFKTPLATLALIAIASISVMVNSIKRSGPSDPAAGSESRWTLICLSVPLVVYGTSALMTHLNIGLRHVLPLYPFVYLLVGLALHQLGRAMRPIAVICGLGLAAETLLALPNYISFFNVAASPFRLALLSDSNLDWGQDLPAVARWQAEHPLTRLYLGYFGAPPPEYYHIRHICIPGGFSVRAPLEFPEQPGVIAISANVLQGLGLPEELRKYYAPLRATRPREILGGSIYLYDVPQPPLARPRQGLSH